MSFGQPPQGGGYGPPPGGYGAPPGGGFGPQSSGPGYGTPPPQGAPPTGPRTDALAIVALIAGLLAVIGAIGNIVSGFCGTACPCCTVGGAIIGAVVAVPAIAAIVCGVLSYRRTTLQPDLYSGKGLALAGAISGGLSLLITILTIVGALLGATFLQANLPDPPPPDDSYDPFSWDAGVAADGSIAIIPGLEPIPPPDPGLAGSACARLAPCCRAYVAALAGQVPASTCDNYTDVSHMEDSTCVSTLEGYRTGLTAMGATIPAECN